MITRTIHGVPFRVISPSFYELASHPEIDISYLGICGIDGEPAWYVTVPDDMGIPQMKAFHTLDEAAKMISGVLGGLH